MSRLRTRWSRDCLIDEGGHVWPLDAPGLRDRIGSDLPWRYLKRFAVETLGYCAVASGPAGSKIMLRPDVTAQPTLVGAFYWLIEQRSERIAISVLEDAWAHRLFTSKWAAVSYLGSKADAQLLARRRDFSSRRRAVDEVAHFAPLAALLRHAGDVGHRYTRGDFAALVRGPLDHRALVLEPNQDATRLIIKDWGSGYRTYSQAWIDRSKGLNVEDQRDFAYASKAAAGYRSAWIERRPRLEDIDARVLDEGGRLHHVSYTRIIVPMADAEGRPVLLGASIVNPAVDVRVEAVDKR